MEEVIQLVRAYRVNTALSEQLQLAERIFLLIEPDMRFFVFKSVELPAGEEILHEVLKAIVTSLDKFNGTSKGEFWKWCYSIARNKLNDYKRAQATKRMIPTPPEELSELLEASAAVWPVSVGDRLDLAYAMDVLGRAKPECREILWQLYMLGASYQDIADERDLSYDGARMKAERCLEKARSLLSND